MTDAFVWNIDREIISFGPLGIRWYSLLFAAGIVIGFYFLRSVFRGEGKREELVDSLLVYVVLGTVIGARLGHCLFYEPAAYLSNPLEILKIWKGGLASHGGYTGVIVALILFARKYRSEVSFFWLTDRVAIPAMLAGSLIRIGNFFNSEIIGRPTDVPWAVVFAKIDNIPRHPTQFYEAFGYFAVFLVLYGVYRMTNRGVKEGRIFGLVLILGYTFRFFVEFFKEHQVGFEQGMTLNMGQMLSIPFALLGVFFATLQHHKFAIFQAGLSTGTNPDDDPGPPQSSAAKKKASKKAPRKGERRKKRKQLKAN